MLINVNLIKYALITGEITTVANNNVVGGYYYGATAISSFSGYPSDVTEIIDFAKVYSYHSSHAAMIFRNDNDIECFANVASTFKVRGLYK